MPRLILLNGPPGIGKSTVARRYADARPGVLCCDIDVLRTLVGGWRQNEQESGSLARTGALALIGAHLTGGHDVVVPQLVARLSEMLRFERVARDSGARLVEVMLTTDPETARRRFHRRTDAAVDPWHAAAAEIVERGGGDEMLAHVHEALRALAASRPATIVVDSRDGDLDGTWRAVDMAVQAFSAER